jgi:two-component system, NtrC family, sensor kinase
VLHNVGNVLNSVNVSAGVVVDAVSQSRLTGLDKAVDLMKSHETDLGAFFTTDAKGKRLPAYLAALSEAAREERAVVVRELESLQKNIDHIKVVVARQQMHAKSTLGFVEAVAARSLLDDALAFNGDSMKRHGVQVVCQVEEIPPVNVDRHKAFEILMNLISNAIQAMKMVEGKRELTLRLEARPDDRFAIVVKDTGCGIAPENLKKVFSHGFTTKREGHGFGLHSSALSAAQMGGVLLAESDGPGQGARFTLELPMSARSSSDVDASDDAA